MLPSHRTLLQYTVLACLIPSVLHAAPTTAGTITNVAGGAKNGISSVRLSFYTASNCTGGSSGIGSASTSTPATTFNNGKSYVFDATAVYEIIEGIIPDPTTIQCFVATILDDASNDYYVSGTGSTLPQFTVNCSSGSRICTSSTTVNID